MERQWTIAAVEEGLIECHELWLRSPGDGRWPYAGDGPWHLAQGEVGDIKGDWSQTLIVNEAGRELMVRKVESRAPRVPLRVAEVAVRDRLGEWLGLLADPDDRLIVRAVVPFVARGERPGWKALAGRLCFPELDAAGEVVGRRRWGRSVAAMAWRYRQALALLACQLGGKPARHARVLMAREGLGREE